MVQDQPVPGGGGTAAAIPGGPVSEFRTLGMASSYLHMGQGWGSLLSLLSDNARVSAVDSEILDLELRARTVNGPALGETTERLERLRSIRTTVDQLSALTIRRPDVDRLRREALDKLLGGAANPPRAAEYEEGRRLFVALQRYARAEERRELVRRRIESLYPPPPSDSQIAYRLNFDGVTDAQLDPWRHPPADRLRSLSVVQTYGSLRGSTDANDIAVADYADRLFDHFRTQNAVYDEGLIGPPNPDTIGFLNGLSGELEGLTTDLNLQTFFDRIATHERTRTLAGGNEAGLASLHTTDGLQAMGQYPALVTALTEYDARVARRVPPIPLDQQRTMLLDTCRLMVRRGERFESLLSGARGSDRPLRSDLEAQLPEARNLVAYLENLGGADLTQANLSLAASRLAPVTQTFQTIEERNVQDGIRRLLDQIERLPSSENNIAPIRADFHTLVTAGPASYADRLAAYRQLAQRIDQAASLRLVDARIASFSEQQGVVRERDEMVNILGVLAGAPIGAADAHRQVSAESREEYTRMRTEYQGIRTMLTSSDPAEVAQGRLLLRQMEGVRQQDVLREAAENAGTFNQIFLVSTIVLATIPLFLEAIPAGIVGGGAVATGEVSLLQLGNLGLRAVLGRTALSLGAQRGLATLGTYALASGVMTGVNRSLTTLILGEQALQHGVGVEFLINMAFMGAGSLAARGMGLVIDAAVEAIAVRNIASRGGGIVLAQGAAAVAPSELSPALRAAIDLEKQQIMQGAFARFLSTAGPLGAEYAAFQTLEFLKTAADLAHRGVPDPAGAAFRHVTSFRTQVFMMGPLILTHTISGTGGDHSGFIAQARRVEYDAIERAYNRDIAAFRRDYADRLFLPDGRPNRELLLDAEFRRRDSEILQHRQDMIALVEPGRRTPEMLAEYGTNQRYLQSLEMLGRAAEINQTVFGDGNRFGVRLQGEDGTTFTYQRRVSGADNLEALLRDYPFADRANVRVYSNGMIEVPILANAFMPEPQTIRLIPASSVRATRPAGVPVSQVVTP